MIVITVKTEYYQFLLVSNISKFDKIKLYEKDIAGLRRNKFLRRRI